MRYASLDLEVKGQARANQYTPRTQDLQQLYDQALAAFEAEGSKSPTPVTVESVESVSPSHVSPHLSTFHLNPPNPAVKPPQPSSSREHREQESADSDDISRIYSIYASDSSNNEHRSSASNYHYHNRNNDLRADDYDNQSIHAMSPISAAASHAKNRPSSPIVFDDNLRHLYGQVLAGFQTEGSQSPAIHNGIDAQGCPVVPPPPPLPSQPSYSMPEPDPYYGDADFGGPSTIVRRPTDILKDLQDMQIYNRDNVSEHYVRDDGPSYGYSAVGDYRQVADEYSFTSSSSARRRRNRRNHRDWTWEYSSDNPDEHNYYSSEELINFSLLSHLAVQLRDKVPREVHTKASIPYERAFTGKVIVDTSRDIASCQHCHYSRRQRQLRRC